ncbi:MAG: hypothetical protein BZ133_05130 [Methanosphaera sp. SHI613]|jgi:hypothetical protein|nr:MAG: hypothetical protein BZ133_05130 [Methanosphaera sp. SHI613]
MKKDNNIITKKEQEILRLTTPLKFVDSAMYDTEGNQVQFTETLTKVECNLEPAKGILDDDEILKYSPDSRKASIIRINNNMANMNDFKKAYYPVIGKITLYYIMWIMMIVPAIFLNNTIVILIFIALLLLPLYKIRQIIKVRRAIKLDKIKTYMNSKNNEYSNINPKFIEYERQILKLKQEFSYKKTNAVKLIEKRFAPPQITYDKFISSVENVDRVFMSESETALDMLRYSNEYSEDIDEQIEVRIKTLKLFNKQIDDLTYELLMNMSKDSKSDETIKNLIDQMDKLIDSVKEYN